MSAEIAIRRMQRSEGLAEVELGPGGRLRELRQRGSARAILPLEGRHGDGLPEVVFLNTSGGLTGGDRLRYGVVLGEGVAAVATTQTAERAYRAGAGEARVEVSLSVGAGGHLDWLPQETILFEGSAVTRRTVLDLAEGASGLMLEAVVLGRAAMGEVVTRLSFRDRREIRLAGRLLHLEPFALDGQSLGAGNATLGEARAFASLVMVGRSAPDRLEALRRVLDEPGVVAAASAPAGRLTCRMMARDAWPLRRQILRALAVLRQGPLPRVWQGMERNT